MDEQRFDQLSRRLGASRTRRQALRTLAGAFAAAVVGVKATATDAEAACRTNYSSCSSDSQCCSGAVCEWGMCMPGCRIDGQFAHPGTSPAGNSCQVCNPAVSTTAGAPTNEGSSCWSGNAFAGPTYCQSGVCAPEGPVSCPPLTACHLEGEINPANGLCVSPPAPEGTPCGIGEMCHGGFYSPAATCDGDGHCIAGGSKTVNCAPYTCAGTACATSCTTNTDCVNGAVCCEGQCAYLNTIDHCGACGNACPTESDNPCLGEAICQQGTCGFAPRPRGTACGDDILCNGAEACDGAGTCQPGIPVACAPCTICDPASGICATDPSQNGAACPGDGNQCFGGFACDAGACVGVDPVICTALDQCHEAGVCDPGTGICSQPPKPDGTVCDDGNACTQNDTCEAGDCIGRNPRICPPAPDACHEASQCAPEIGCVPPVLTVDFLNDAEHCGTCGNVCTPVDACTPASCDNGSCNQTSNCTDPENGTGFCAETGCDFTCNDGFELNEAGDGCVPLPLCPAGYEPVNEACFPIVNDPELYDACWNRGCVASDGFSSDRSNELCARLEGDLISCRSTSECPTGQACHSLCHAPCPF